MKKGHNRGVIAGDQLLQYIERIERLDEEKKTITTDINEVYTEAENNGFDKKIMKALIALRKVEQSDRDEHFTMLHVYANAIGMQLSLFTNDDLEQPQSTNKRKQAA